MKNTLLIFSLILLALSSNAHDINDLSYNKNGDRLRIEISYSGGCKDHAFTFDFKSQEMNQEGSMNYYFHLNHALGSDDSCQALLFKTLEFPLSGIVTHPSRIYISTHRDGSHPFVMEVDPS